MRYLSASLSSHLYSWGSRWIGFGGNLKLLLTKPTTRKCLTARNENEDLQLSVILTLVLIKFLSITIKQFYTYNWKLHSSLCVREDHIRKAFVAVVDVQFHEFLTRELDGTDVVYRTNSLRVRIRPCQVGYEGMWGPAPAWGQRKREYILPFLDLNPDPSVSIVAYSLYWLKGFITML